MPSLRFGVNEAISSMQLLDQGGLVVDLRVRDYFDTDLNNCNQSRCCDLGGLRYGVRRIRGEAWNFLYCRSERMSISWIFDRSR